jgi:dephospho-CoA kinase
VSGQPAPPRREGRPVLIGITGPIGCGKSTIAGWLAELGAHVIDADEVARDVLDPGTSELAAVVGAFGDGVLLPDGRLDRSALAGIVFADPAALARLEAIVHPAVRRLILASVEDARRAAAPAVIIEAIKLVEGGLAELCDEVWLVTCEATAQAARLAARGLDAADARARAAAQAGMVERVRARANRLIDTSGALERTRGEALRAYRAALAAEPARDL